MNVKLNLKENKIILNDLQALDKIIDLVKAFSDKILINKRKFDDITFKNKIEQLKNVSNKNEHYVLDEFLRILEKLKFIVRKEILPEVFFILGGHGGIIINDIGFCEFDSPSYALKRLVEKMKLALETSMPYNLEVAVSCLRWLKNRHPEEFSQFVKLFQQGRFGIINPAYSQPYCLIIGAESNIKQFEYGLKALHQMGLDCNMYYASECSVHPQIPQILRGFGINFCSLRTRLLGMNPSTPFGNIDWLGLDNTKIQSMTDQSGIFNGELWHGGFFQEIPNLLFQAVARPFVKYIVYSSLEDFVMPLPYQEEIWRISKFVDIFGKFISCSEFFQLTEKNGEFKFTIDSFYLGDNIFLPSELFLNNKKCEIDIISTEILNCVLKLYKEDSRDNLIENLWEQLLLTQAHDNYAVPFMRNGDYSERQLSVEEFQKLDLGSKKIAISKLSNDVQKKIQHQCEDLIADSLSKLAKHLSAKTKDASGNNFGFLVFNPTIYSRQDLVSIQCPADNPSEMILKGDEGEIIDFSFQDSVLKFLAKMPPIGYKLYSLIKRERRTSTTSKEQYFYSINISEDAQSIEVKFKGENVCELRFKSKLNYRLELFEHKQYTVEDKYEILGNMNKKNFKIEITQSRGVNRLEFVLNSYILNQILVNPRFSVLKSWINYPFGIEETKRSSFQTLDFLWLTGRGKGLLYMQKNSQRFSIDRNTFSFTNSITRHGIFEFAIAITNEDSLDKAYYYSKTYLFKLFGIKINDIDESMERAKSFLSIKPPNTLENAWTRGSKSYLRIFNPSNENALVDISGLLVKGYFKEIDFNYNEIKEFLNGEHAIGSWKVKTLEI